MIIRATNRRSLATTLAFAIAMILVGCGSKEPPPAASTTATAPAPAAVPGATAVPAVATTAQGGTWSPEAMEELLAPIALYPDPVLSQMLIASTNPQEVLDAGNWLLQNETLKGKALDDAAAAVGFTPPIRALVQFPETIDMMCLEMGWTTELGEAFTADQAGVLDAIQRLRKQAQDVGNLKSSDQMVVESVEQEGKDVVVLKPAQPEVVYVPQYDPQTAYAPPPPAAAAPVATTATTATTSTETTTGHSTGSMVATGVLAFGAGILVNELFDDDDDHHNDYYYPNYGHGGMPYYPPYPYRPTYGNGYYPSNGYNRPPNYNSGFQNTGNIYINTGGNNRPGGGNDNYWNRFDNNPRAGGVNGATNRATANTYDRARTGQSPITAARPNRTAELNQLSQRQPRPMPADVKRPSPNATASNWKGQSGYAGKANKSGGSAAAADRIAQATPAYSKPASKSSGTRDSQAKPKVQGSYAGAANRSTRDDTNRPATVTRDTPKKPSTRDEPRPKPRPETGNVQRPTSGDRGYGAASRPSLPAQQPERANRPSPAPAAGGGGGGSRPTAMSGANRGAGDRAASQRGRQSMPQGARSKGGGGGRQGR